jgi:hypothetical protein
LHGRERQAGFALDCEQPVVFRQPLAMRERAELDLIARQPTASSAVFDFLTGFYAW